MKLIVNRMKIKFIILAGSGILTLLGDTIPPLPPTFYRAIKIAGNDINLPNVGYISTTNSTILSTNTSPTISLDTTGLLQTEVVTNWSDSIPKSAVRPILTPMLPNGGYEFGLLVTNQFIDVIHDNQHLKTIISSKTNYNIIFERRYEFTRSYNSPAWIVQETR